MCFVLGLGFFYGSLQCFVRIGNLSFCNLHICQSKIAVVRLWKLFYEVFDDGLMHILWLL